MNMYCRVDLSLIHKLPRCPLTLLHSERPKLYTILAFLSAKGLKEFGYTFKGKQLFHCHFFLQLLKERICSCTAGANSFL